jgi:hypothetical protein
MFAGFDDPDVELMAALSAQQAGRDRDAGGTSADDQNLMVSGRCHDRSPELSGMCAIG